MAVARSSGARRAEKMAATEEDGFTGPPSNGAELPRFDVALGDQPDGITVLAQAAKERDAAVKAMAARNAPGASRVDHNANLVEYLDPLALSALQRDLMEEVNSAIDSRKPWLDLFTKGVRRMGVDREQEKRSEPFPGASAVVHPALAQACVDFQARASGQLYPPDGPAKAAVEGEVTPERADAAERVERYANWQCTIQMPEYAPEGERLLMMLPIEGSSFEKLWWDDAVGRPRVSYISSVDIIAPYNASDEMTTPLLAERLRVFEHQRTAYVASGFWAPHEVGPAPMREVSDVEEALKGVTGQAAMSGQAEVHEQHEYYECQVRRAITGLEGDQVAEWLVTIHPATQKIVAIRRNWDKDDPAKERRRIIFHYKMFPWAGFYGVGLFHLIGGLTQAATGALRALLDSAMASTMGGGLKLGFGKGNGGTIVTGPGIFADVQAAGTDDIRKVVMPNIFPPPSPVLFELLQFVTGAAQEFASVALKEVAESNQNVPVGTTLARLDEGSRVYSGIYQRLHRVQGLKLQTLYRINAKTLQQQIAIRPYVDSKLTLADFGRDISVSPVSDPHTYSLIQRTMKAQARLDLARQARAEGVNLNLEQAYRATAKAMGLPDVEELFPEAPPPVSADPFTENLAAVRGSPLEAKPTDDDDMHLFVHHAAAMLPGLYGTPAGQTLVAHMHQHAANGAMKLAMAGKLAKEQALPADDLTDPGEWYAGWMQKIGECMKPMADPGVAAVAEVERAKVEATKEKTKVDTAAKLMIEGERSENKREELALMHEQKMREIEAQDDAKEADIARDVAMKREDIASRERVTAAQIMAKAATPPPAKPGEFGEEEGDDGEPGKGKPKGGDADLWTMIEGLSAAVQSLARGRKIVRDDKGDIIGVEPA